MQSIAKAIEKELPDKWGFFVLCFPFNASPDSIGEYASNGRREDVMEVMRRFVEKNPMQRESLN